ncbi:MAG: ABC transporter ATP-binding protein [Bacillota bacterium]
MSERNAIEITNLSFTYPNGFEALKDIDIAIKKGEFVAVIGQNGAGKSTLLKNITGLLKPTKGDILVDGANTKKISVAEISTKLGFVLQNPDRQLFADTVEEEVAFGSRNLKLPEEQIKERMEYAIEVTGLDAVRKQFPPSLSAGERAKTVIASVVAMRPDIIVLDEPTTGQDRRGCYQIMEIAKVFHGLGHTVIMVTHHMRLVAEYAQRTVVFCKGAVLLDGPTREVFSQTETLRQSYIVPPQITQIGHILSGETNTYLNVKELTDRIVRGYSGM